MKVGLIGVGYWGKNYVRICEKNNLEIKTACDLNQERKNILPKKINFTTDYKDILNDIEIECVIICTPASTHHKICKEFLNNNKHVLVEKPTCIKKEDCNELIEIAKIKNIVFMTDYTFLFNSRVRFLKDYLKENIKKPIQVKFIRKNYGPIRNDVNVLWDLLSHDISIFLYLFDIEDIDFLRKESIKISHYSHEKNIDSCNIFLNYKNINIVFEVSWLDLEKERKIIFSDTTKKIIIDDIGPPVTILTRENDDIGEYFIGSYQQQFNKLEPSIKIDEPLDTMIKKWKYFLIGNRDNLEKLNNFSVNTTEIICYLNSLIEKKNKVICVAGKNEIGVFGLQTVKKFFSDDYEIVYLPNLSDRGYDTWQPSLKKLGQKLKLREVTLEEIYEIENLIFISLEFEKIIKTDKFKSKNLYNIHFSKLPSYRGMYTSSLPILHGKKETGVTLHRIDDGIDTGDIIDQIVFPIDDNDTARDLYFKYNNNAKLLLLNNINNLVNCSIISRCQEKNNASYFSKNYINFKDIKLNFNKTAFEVKNQIRAYSFKEYQFPKFKNTNVYKCVITNIRSLYYKPGILIKDDNIKFTISTIDYNVELYKT